METDPLILTLRLDPVSAERFDHLRQAHFPKDRNWLHAHLTMFHRLPGEELASLSARLARTAAEEARFPLAVRGLRSLGRGVAYRIESARLLALREELARQFGPWLGLQDRAGFAPHVTVQNKVSSEEARALLRKLESSFEPFDATATGLDLWHYRNGPWEHASGAAFG